MGVPHGCARVLPNTALRRTLSPASRGVLQSHPAPRPPYLPPGQAVVQAELARLRPRWRRPRELCPPPSACWRESTAVSADEVIPCLGGVAWIQRLSPQRQLCLLTSERQRIPQPLPPRARDGRHTCLPPLAPSTGNPRWPKMHRQSTWLDGCPAIPGGSLWRLWGWGTTSRPRKRLGTAASPWPRMVSTMACSPGSISSGPPAAHPRNMQTLSSAPGIQSPGLHPGPRAFGNSLRAHHGG